MIKEMVMKKRAIILPKPSGTITIGGELNVIQKRFYDGFLYTVKRQIEEKPGRMWFEVSLKDLKELLPTSDKDKHNTYYKKQILKLNDIKVEYNILEKDWLIEGYTYLITDVKFIENIQTKEVVIKFDVPNMVKEAILNKNKNALFAKVDLMIKKNLKSRYSLTLYDLLKDYEGAEIPEMAIEEFREIFGLRNKYKYFNDLKKRVLKPMVNEINNNSHIDWKIDYKLIKAGNTYTHIKFIKTKKDSVKSKQLSVIQNKNKEHKIEALILLIPEVHRGKTRGVIKKALEKYPVDYIEAQIKLANNKQDIKDYVAFLKSAIKEDYACFKENKKEIEERKKREEEQKRKAEENLIKLKKLKKEFQQQAKKIINSWSKEEYEQNFEKIKKISIIKDEEIIRDSLVFSVMQELLKNAVENGKIREDIASEILKV